MALCVMKIPILASLSCLLALFSLAFAATPGAGQATTGQTINVCTFTIGDREALSHFKEEFRNNAIDRQHVRVIELGPPAAYDPGWFNKTCESHPALRCDIVAISGHFGGDFFGDGRANFLPIEQLDQLACKNALRKSKCPGLLGAATEVFLIGCNTLADKNRDERADGEYKDLLIRDGFEPIEAEHSVMTRYQNLGKSFRDMMKNIFTGAKHLYGFYRPTAKSPINGPLLGQYVRSIQERYGSYYDYFRNHSNGANSILQEIMDRGSVSFYQTMGVPLDHPKFQLYREYCSLKDKGTSPAKGLKALDLLMARSDEMSNFYAYLEFLTMHPTRNFGMSGVKLLQSKLSSAELSYFERIKVQHSSLAKEYLDLLSDLDYFPYVQIEIAKFLYQLDWLKWDEFESIEKRAASAIASLYQREYRR